jgi:predicted secreted Zn-dependent protease
MSIRPVDMQVTVQKSPDINRAQNNEANRPEAAQQHFSQKLQREVEQRDQQVVQTNRSEDRNVDKDGKGSGGFAGSNKKRQPSKKNDDKEKRPGSSLLDISI